MNKGIIVRVVGGTLNKAARISILQEDGRAIIKPVDVDMWKAAKSRLLGGASGCFASSNGNGKLVAILGPGQLLRFLCEANLIIL